MVVLLFTSFFTTSVAADETEGTKQFMSEEEFYEKDIEYRKDNNLDYSLKHIKNVNKNPKANKSIEKYSVNLTDEELSYIKERDQLMSDVGKEIQKLMKGSFNFSQFGSFHQSTEKGLKFVISFSENTKETSAVKNKIKDIAPSNLLTFKQVEYSEQDLVDMINKINEDMKESILEENEITDMSVNLFDNKVDIALKYYNEIDANLLLKKYGSNIIQVSNISSTVEPESRRSNYWTMVGGLQIANTSFNSTSVEDGRPRCTLGLSAIKNGVYYFITAGHCIDGWGTYTYQGGKSIGTNHFHTIQDYADIGLIKRSSTVGASNGMYKYQWNDDSVQDYQSHSSEISVGDGICMSGITSGFNCKKVTSTYASASANGQNYVGFMRSDIDSEPGDSGAPYWYNDILMGVHQGGPSDSAATQYSIFTHISHAIRLGGAWTPLH